MEELEITSLWKGQGITNGSLKSETLIMSTEKNVRILPGVGGRGVQRTLFKEVNGNKKHRGVVSLGYTGNTLVVQLG